MASLGKALRDLRQNAGLSQFEFCKQADMGMSAYTHLEVQGPEKDGSVKLETLRKIAKFYGMKPSELLKSIGE